MRDIGTAPQRLHGTTRRQAIGASGGRPQNHMNRSVRSILTSVSGTLIRTG
jgi:hypothetical protein